VLAWHCLRRGWRDDRTALISRVRGLFAEFGVWVAQSPEALKRSLPRLREDETLPLRMRTLLTIAYEELCRIEGRIDLCEIEIRAHAQQNDAARRVEAIIGVGPVTASAVAATVTNAGDFKNGRQMAAWLGLVPKQFSSGGKISLGKITKRGDTYVRGLLTGGARSALIAALRKSPDKRSRLQNWMVEARGHR